MSHFRSSSIKDVQSSLETAWQQCHEKPQDLPLYKLRDNSGKLVYSKLNEAGPPVGETDDSEETEVHEQQRGTGN